MNIQNTMAKRPKLSICLTNITTRETDIHVRAGNLSRAELQRIIAELLG